MTTRDTFENPFSWLELIQLNQKKALETIPNPGKEVNEEARKAGVELVQEGTNKPNWKTYIYVNNRLEGNALETIAAMLALAD